MKNAPSLAAIQRRIRRRHPSPLKAISDAALFRVCPDVRLLAEAVEILEAGIGGSIHNRGILAALYWTAGYGDERAEAIAIILNNIHGSN